VVTELLDPRGTPAVEIRDFAQLVVDARLYGSRETQATVYKDDAVLLVSGA
jgi:hypothetical protein